MFDVSSKLIDVGTRRAYFEVAKTCITKREFPDQWKEMVFVLLKKEARGPAQSAQDEGNRINGPGAEAHAEVRQEAVL